MALTPAHFKFYLSGGVSSLHGNNNADPANALGGGMSTVEVNWSTLFGSVKTSEINSQYVYRGIWMKNTAPYTGVVAQDSLYTAYNLRLWVTGLPPNLSIAMASNASAVTFYPDVAGYYSSDNLLPGIASQYSTPTMGSATSNAPFADYTTYAEGNTGGPNYSHMFSPGKAVGIWLRRYATTGYNTVDGGFTLNLKFSVLAEPA